jgi:hypothetical protein
MCGIGGFIRPKEFVTCTESALLDLNYFNRVRGIDALGAFKLNNSTKKTETIKEVGDPAAVIKRQDFNAFFKNPGDSKYFVMHNRSATRGSKDDIESAHPFVEEKANGKGAIVMVHNGTITSNAMQKEFPGVNDSHSLTKMVAAGMPIEDIEACIYGGYALVWLDTEDQSIHFTRNDQRPFGFVHCPDSIWFGSETYMVGASIARRGFKIEKFEFLKPMEEWVWHFDGKELEKRNFTPKQKTASKGYGSFGNNGYHYGSHHHGYEGGDRFPFGGSSQGGSTSGGSSTSLRDPKILQLPATHTRNRRPKFAQVKEHEAYKKGDNVIFSLDDFEATEQGKVKFKANAVIFGSREIPELTEIEIYGMHNGPINLMDESKAFWMGKITNIATATIGGKKYYRFNVREPKPCEGVDPFRFPVESSETEGLASSPLEPKAQSGSRGTPTKISDKDWLESRPCYNCGVYFPNSEIYVNKHAKLDVELDLCVECLGMTAADTALLFKLFDDKRKTGHPIFVDPEAPNRVMH